jgi:hypothetical protein
LPKSTEPNITMPNTPTNAIGQWGMAYRNKRRYNCQGDNSGVTARG